ncbi:MAG: 7-cyano-7-deazaguanine synthase [Rhodomicrobium sp.]|nr:MAG: 7-cyano-7-deazaguanine synthase [Rhodomicrobium sp.]
MASLKHLDQRRALVLFSGGQDSTTALAYALKTFDYVETVGFNYGQRNVVELDCRDRVIKSLRDKLPQLGDKLGPDRVLELSTFHGLSNSALTDQTSEITTGETGLPTSFVPGRNLFFFHYAAVIGYNNYFGVLVGGMCQTDFSGYPDCRQETLSQLETVLNLGMETNFKIITPLMDKTKAESWELAHEIGGDQLVEIVRKHSHSCYNGERTALNAWGYGCGECPACMLRQKGYEEWRGFG